MKPGIAAIAAVLACAAPAVVRADGYTIRLTKDGHFREGTRYTVELTAGQMEMVAARKAELKTQGTDRLTFLELELTAEQTRRLRESTGKTVRRIGLFEKEFSDCGCAGIFPNLASLLAPNLAELSSKYLVDQSGRGAPVDPAAGGEASDAGAEDGG